MSSERTPLLNSDTQTSGDESPVNNERDTMSWFPVLREAREARGISTSPSGQQVTGLGWSKEEQTERTNGLALGVCTWRPVQGQGEWLLPVSGSKGEHHVISHPSWRPHSSFQTRQPLKLQEAKSQLPVMLDSPIVTGSPGGSCCGKEPCALGHKRNSKRAI